MSATSADLISAIDALLIDAMNAGVVVHTDVSRNVVDVPVPSWECRTYKPGHEITITLVLADAE